MEEKLKLNMQMYDTEILLAPLQKLNLMDDFLIFCIMLRKAVMTAYRKTVTNALSICIERFIRSNPVKRWE